MNRTSLGFKSHTTFLCLVVREQSQISAIKFLPWVGNNSRNLQFKKHGNPNSKEQLSRSHNSQINSLTALQVSAPIVIIAQVARDTSLLPTIRLNHLERLTSLIKVCTSSKSQYLSDQLGTECAVMTKNFKHNSR